MTGRIDPAAFKACVEKCDRLARDLVDARRVISDAHDLLQRGQWQGATQVVATAVQKQESRS